MKTLSELIIDDYEIDRLVFNKNVITNEIFKMSLFIIYHGKSAMTSQVWKIRPIPGHMVSSSRLIIDYDL